MGTPVVALVLVSHSRMLAEGVAEVAGQMAPDVLLVPAGGTDDGRIGTGFDLVTEALARAVENGRSAVVLTDLGSSALTVETVLEMASPAVAARVRVADAPLVEGAVEAAVVAQGGADLATVLEAAEDAAASFTRSAGSGAGPLQDVRGPEGAVEPRPAQGARAGAASRHADVAAAAGGGGAVEASRVADAAATTHPGVAPTAPGAVPAPTAHAGGVPTARGTAVLRNRLGLHARPAAQVARTAGAFDAVITVNGADARSVLALVGLGAVGGQEVVVAATGPQARTAVIAVVDELENGFGEA